LVIHKGAGGGQCENSSLTEVTQERRQEEVPGNLGKGETLWGMSSEGDLQGAVVGTASINDDLKCSSEVIISDKKLRLRRRPKDKRKNR